MSDDPDYWDDDPKCPRCKQPGAHGICPYDEDINNTKHDCTCCNECRHECAMDI